MELQSYSRFDKVSVILNIIRYFLFASIGKFVENIKSLSKSLFIHTICNASWARDDSGDYPGYWTAWTLARSQSRIHRILLSIEPQLPPDGNDQTCKQYLTRIFGGLDS